MPISPNQYQYWWAQGQMPELSGGWALLPVTSHTCNAHVTQARQPETSTVSDAWAGMVLPCLQMFSNRDNRSTNKAVWKPSATLDWMAGLLETDFHLKATQKGSRLQQNTVHKQNYSGNILFPLPEVLGRVGTTAATLFRSPVPSTVDLVFPVRLTLRADSPLFKWSLACCGIWQQ